MNSSYDKQYFQYFAHSKNVYLSSLRNTYFNKKLFKNEAVSSRQRKFLYALLKICEENNIKIPKNIKQPYTKTEFCSVIDKLINLVDESNVNVDIKCRHKNVQKEENKL